MIVINDVDVQVALRATYAPAFVCTKSVPQNRIGGAGLTHLPPRVAREALAPGRFHLLNYSRPWDHISAISWGRLPSLRKDATALTRKFDPRLGNRAERRKNARSESVGFAFVPLSLGPHPSGTQLLAHLETLRLQRAVEHIAKGRPRIPRSTYPNPSLDELFDSRGPGDLLHILRTKWSPNALSSAGLLRQRDSAALATLRCLAKFYERRQERRVYCGYGDDTSFVYALMRARRVLRDTYRARLTVHGIRREDA